LNELFYPKIEDRVDSNFYLQGPAERESLKSVKKKKIGNTL